MHKSVRTKREGRCMSPGGQEIAQWRGLRSPRVQLTIFGWDGPFQRCLSLEHRTRRNAVVTLVWQESRVTREVV